jgi:hypothetical protein
MRQWANCRPVAGSTRSLSGIPPAQIPRAYLGSHPDGLLEIHVTGTARPHIFRPLGICLIVLAVAIVLWGIGYKLSLYRPHLDPSARVSVAKLWVGPRKAVCFSSPTQRVAPPSPYSQLAQVQNHTFPSGRDPILVISAAPVSNGRVRLLLRSLRSPPTPFL